MKRLLLMIVILMALSPAQGVDFFSRSPDSVPAEVEAMYVKGLNALVQFQQRAGNWNDGEGGGPGVWVWQFWRCWRTAMIRMTDRTACPSNGD